MLGIVFSTEEEAAPFLQKYERGRFDGLSEGETLHDDMLLVTLTGLGKIKTTLRTERMLQHFKEDVGLTRLLHIGTCTALTDRLPVGTVVAAAQVLEGDRIELAAPAYPRMPLDVPFDDLPQGTLVTQDHLVQGQQERTYWQRIADMIDMAGYPIAYVAATHGLPCHLIKVVTGHLNAPDADLRKTLSMAHQTIADFLLARLNTLAAV
ncbi:5'-methylthioadenosine nucleosidase [Rhodocaloribacter litoris]|uniref:5'-methylthioadenosine/S-adenosylhomocysteine nucleosidase family protein n=1 Tax=Rhodocaloribacter litoris TaxID=2558931 RepID=UPI0014236864|nr:5'-methylthioadenosine nucleosidase [Rhodocaloribacter litoris]QXD14386.1 5'-methylthioadenosine nucleosidase [Rhodocaloribacter litoris]